VIFENSFKIDQAVGRPQFERIFKYQ